MTTKGNEIIDVTVGRFNPLTVYHRRMIESFTASRKWVFTTKTHNDKNPLLWRDKVDMMQRALPGTEVHACQDPIDMLEQISRYAPGARIRLHCGSDRAWDYQRLNTYAEQFGVAIVEIVSHVRLDPTHSATYLREAVKNSRRDKFNDLCGYRGRDRDVAYSMIQEYFGRV